MPGTPDILTSIHGRQLGLGPNGELIAAGSRVSNGRNLGPFGSAPGFLQDPSFAFEFFDDFLNPASATASDNQAYTDRGGRDAAGRLHQVRAEALTR